MKEVKKSFDVREITSIQMLEMFIKKVFGTYFVEDSKWPAIATEAERSIGRTYFFDRKKQQYPFNNTASRKIYRLYEDALNGKSKYDAVQISQSLTKIFDEHFSVGIDYLNFYIDDIDDLRKQKINCWLILLNVIISMFIDCEKVSLQSIQFEVLKVQHKMIASVAKYSKDTYTEQVIQQFMKKSVDVVLLKDKIEESEKENAKSSFLNDPIVSKNTIMILEVPEDTEEAYVLGCQYEFGTDGTTIDYMKARKFYKKAADSGHIYAQYNYGLLLLHGRGGTVNEADAMYYLEQSANNGVTNAMYNLGLMYFHGVNYEKAFNWLSHASKAGHMLAHKWIKYCTLFIALQDVTTLPLSQPEVKFANDISDLIDVVTKNDLVKILDKHITIDIVTEFKDGFLRIAAGAEENAIRVNDTNSMEFWNNMQAAILLFIFLGEQYHVDVYAFISNIQGQLFMDSWNEQLKASDDNAFESNMFKIAVHEFRKKSKFQNFWSVVIKCADLLRRVERKMKSVTENKNIIAIRKLNSVCGRFCVEIKGLSYLLNENTDIYIRGSIEALDGYKRQGKLVVKADLYNRFGQILYTLHTFGELKLHLNVFETFELNCINISRFVDVNEIHTISTYPSWN